MSKEAEKMINFPHQNDNTYNTKKKEENICFSTY